jgi:hypothetical protein
LIARLEAALAEARRKSAATSEGMLGREFWHGVTSGLNQALAMVEGRTERNERWEDERGSR